MKQLQILHGVFERLEADLANQAYGSRAWRQYIDQIKAEELEHRRFTPAGCVNTLPVARAVELFAVQYILRFWSGEWHEPKAAAYFDLKRSVFAAWAIYRMLRVRHVTEEERDVIMGLDYARLNNQQRGMV